MAAAGSYKCSLTPELIKKAEAELNEKEKWRARDIQGLRDMVLAHKGLKSRTDDEFLLRFLRARKFDYDRAYELIINYYTIRVTNADVLRDLTPKAVSHVFDSGVVAMLPKRGPDGVAILYFRPGVWNPADFSIMDIARANILNLEMAIMEEETQVCGVILIGNMVDMGMAQVKGFERNYAKIMTGLMQDAFPLRFKGIHFVNEPAVFGTIFAIVKPFMKEKLVSRLNFHGSSLDGLYKVFSKDVLPQELGGTLPPSNQLAAEWKKKLLDHQQMFEDMKKYSIVVERKIINTKTSETPECVTGAYRKLNVD